MTNFTTIKKTWEILDTRERRNAAVVATVMVLAALSSALMVASIVPFLSVLADPSMIQERRILKSAYELGGFESPGGFVVALGIASILVIVVGNAIQILRVYVIARYSSMRGHSISYRLLSSYLRQPYLFFLSQHSGEMGTQVLSESQQLVDRCIRPAAEALAATLTIVCMVALLLFVEPVISIVAFLTIASIYLAITVFTRTRIRKFGLIRISSNQRRFRLANESLSGIKDIKQLSREKYYLKQFAGPSRDMAHSIAQIAMIGQIPQYVIMAVTFSGIILLCLYLTSAAAGADRGNAMGSIVPTLGFVAFAGQRLMPELSRLFQSVTRLTSAGPSVDIIHDALIANCPDESFPDRPPKPLGLKDCLQLDNVSFLYPNSERAGLRSLSISIHVGERIGIVGGTGSGKTTLANIILGLLVPNSGVMKVDGHPITSENRRAWQATIGYVPQDIFLTDATIRENIAFGILKSNIDEDRVRFAAEIAYIDDFVLTELPQGYDTQIGERGVRLSGGQRQRIGIARAAYNNAEMILFDEATSALDNVTEKEVMRSIDALPGDKTLVMIAHRLSTLRGCDRILVLRQGEVVGFGTWEALERDCKEFRDIAQSAETA